MLKGSFQILDGHTSALAL